MAAVVHGWSESAAQGGDEQAREDVPIVIRLPREARNLEAIQSIRLAYPPGTGAS